MAEFPAMNVLRNVPRFSEGVFPNIKQIMHTVRHILSFKALSTFKKKSWLSMENFRSTDGRTFSYFSKVAFYKAQHWILHIFHIFFKQNQNI